MNQNNVEAMKVLSLRQEDGYISCPVAVDGKITEKGQALERANIQCCAQLEKVRKRINVALGAYCC